MANDSTPDRLSVSLVLHHSDTELLHSTLDSLQRAIASAIESGQLSGAAVTVVDNSDSQSYGDQVRRLIDGMAGAAPVAYRAADRNLGFGGGNNEAMLGVDSDFHLILNPDVEMAETALVEGLAHLQADASSVMLSPHVSADDGSQEFLCKRYPSVWVLLLRAFAPEFMRAWFRKNLEAYEMRDLCAGTDQVDVTLASGCFMLTRTPPLQAIAGFDERYFLYFEDYDLCLRLAPFGRIVFDPAVEIIHHGGYAASKGWRHVHMFVSSGIRFFNSHGWRWI